MIQLPQLTCRKCSVDNPMVYFAPVTIDSAGTCICYNCVESRKWLDRDGNLKEGINL